MVSRDQEIGGIDPLTTKGDKGTSQGDKNVPRTVGRRAAYICQNSWNYSIKIRESFTVNDATIKH